MDPDFNEYLANMPVVTKKVLCQNKMSFDDVCALHYSLGPDEPLSWYIFLSRRPDLPENQVKAIHGIIKRLNDNTKAQLDFELEKIQVKEQLKRDKDKYDEFKLLTELQ